MREIIIVAIHGIGEPVRFQTIQSVAYQFCQYFRAPAGIPLGRFHAELLLPDGADGAPGAFMVETPPDPKIGVGIGFAEVYWADVPRGPAKDLYTLEESRKWAKTVVERVRALDFAVIGQLNLGRKDYLLAAQVIDEMIETSQVLGNLLYLAKKANVFTFDLDRVLIDYLGDVQVVVEFANYRKQILNMFQGVMKKIHEKHDKAEIHIVAHSEGTVIALLGLLRALHLPAPAPGAARDAACRPEWVEQIRGLMTIGSPINKHLLLWPELWRELENPPCPPPTTIKWRNYYDFGDPIGFRLDAARTWLDGNGWKGYFEFDAEQDDIGFTRYLFPGQAHSDYWTDQGVFGHFIHHVDKPDGAPARHGSNPYPRPGNRPLARVLSPTLPYLLCIALVFLGVYLLYKAVVASVQSSINEDAWDVLRNVAGISYMLIGVTAAVRIPRLTRHIVWRMVGFTVFASSLWVLPLLATDDFLNNRIGRAILVLDKLPYVGAAFDRAHWLAKLACIPNVQRPASGVLSVIGVAFVTAFVIGFIRPSWGAKPLLYLGGIIICCIVAFRLSETNKDESRLREALARQTGLTDNQIDEVSHEVMGLIARDSDSSQNFDAKAATYTRMVFRKPEFAGQVSKCRCDPPMPARRSPELELPADARGPEGGPTWPVVVAGAAFLYLWWLATLLFDLVVVWQHYIRSSAILRRLQEIHPVSVRTAGRPPAQQSAQ